MLAVHLENLLFLLLLVVAGLFQLLGRADRKRSGEEETQAPKPCDASHRHPTETVGTGAAAG